MVKVHVNTREFKQVIALYQRATGKDEVWILNKVGGDMSLRAMGKTKKARLGKMRATKAYDPDKTPSTYKSQFHFALARKKGIPTDLPSVRKFYRRRRSSSGYIKAGFLQPARDFGKRPRLRPHRGGDAARSRGKKATESRRTANILQNSDGAESVGLGGVNAAFPLVIANMKNYANKRLAKTARKYSGK